MCVDDARATRGLPCGCIPYERLSLLGQQAQRVAVRWAHHREVTAVEGRDFGLPQLLAGDDHGGIHEPEIEGRVALLELRGSYDALGIELVQPVGAALEILGERAPGFGRIPFPKPIVDLDQYGGGDDQVFTGRINHRPACIVIRVGGIQQGSDRPGVEDERQTSAATAMASWGVLVLGDLGSGGTVASKDPESRHPLAAKALRLGLDRFAQNLGQRDAAALRFSLEQVEVI